MFDVIHLLEKGFHSLQQRVGRAEAGGSDDDAMTRSDTGFNTEASVFVDPAVSDYALGASWRCAADVIDDPAVHLV